METIPLSNVALVDTATVSKDGRIYVGKKFAKKNVKVVLLDEEDADE